MTHHSHLFGGLRSAPRAGRGPRRLRRRRRGDRRGVRDDEAILDVSRRPGTRPADVWRRPPTADRRPRTTRGVGPAPSPAPGPDDAAPSRPQSPIEPIAEPPPRRPPTAEAPAPSIPEDAKWVKSCRPHYKRRRVETCEAHCASRRTIMRRLLNSATHGRFSSRGALGGTRPISWPSLAPTECAATIIKLAGGGMVGRRNPSMRERRVQ